MTMIITIWKRYRSRDWRRDRRALQARESLARDVEESCRPPEVLYQRKGNWLVQCRQKGCIGVVGEEEVVLTHQ